VRLHTRSWGAASGETVVAVHGLTQHGGVFEGLGERLAAAGRRLVAVDLRGHGESGREPPWSVDAHVADLVATLQAGAIRRSILVGHSFGGLLVAALAARAVGDVAALVLLDPGIGLPPEGALASAEIERLDWSFDSVDGAVNALRSSESIVATPRETLVAFAAADLQRGRDGRLRFSFSPSAAVVAWSEMAAPPPPIAQLPTLLIRPVSSQIPPREQDARYRRELGSLLSLVAVPNGHNVLWESPQETGAAIEDFLAATG
jgi:lipase